MCAHDYFHPEILNHPESIVVFAGGQAEFVCMTSGAEFISWKVNGTSALDHHFLIETRRQFSIITISALAEYNGTVVNCVAEDSRRTTIESDNATLFIQGKLKLDMII